MARTEMYAAELEKRLLQLRDAEATLAAAQRGKNVSEDKFQNVFRSSPIPFSITTVKEGRFLDVNAAFERRYGYSREELLGRAIQDTQIWAEPADRIRIVEQMCRGTPIRNLVTRLRPKSGEVKLTAHSADRIHFEGESCILAASEDLREFDERKAN